MVELKTLKRQVLPDPDIIRKILTNRREKALVDAWAWCLTFNVQPDRTPPPNEDRREAERMLRDKGLID